MPKENTEMKISRWNLLTIRRYKQKYFNYIMYIMEKTHESRTT